MRPRVKRIALLGAGWFVAPMFVHPQPRRGIFSHVRFERIPTRLRDLLMVLAFGVDRSMKNDPVSTARERLAMRGNNRRASLLVQPTVRRCHVRLQTEAIDRDRRKGRMQGKVAKQRGG